MLIAAYLGCLFFWDKLKHIGYKQYTFLWASIYGLILVITLLTDPSLTIMSGAGPKTSASFMGIETQLSQGAMHIIAPWFYVLFISTALASIFYVVLKLLHTHETPFRNIFIVGGGFLLSQFVFYLLAYPYLVIR